MQQAHTVKGALKELRGQILNTWETLADEELKKAKENVTELSEMLHQKYDETKDQLESRFSFILSRFHAGFDQAEPQVLAGQKKRQSKNSVSNAEKLN